MRPTTPNFNFAQQAGPSSPPQTPTTSAFPLKANRRNGMHFSKPTLPTKDSTITPNGNGPFFSYTPSARPEDLSPRSSSSAASSSHSSSSESPPRSLSSSPAVHTTSSPPSRRKVVTESNFTLEEFSGSAYEEWESGDEDVIRPYQYEDADSEKAHSVKSSGGRSKTDLDPLLDGIRGLSYGNEEEDEHERWVQLERARKKSKRRSSGTKRTITQSIGSDTDDEDLQPVMLEGVNEVGSSARRLRRKVGERTSLIFDDPPSRIDEEDEGPESCEEVVVIEDDDEE
ncbi:hypothetical protein L207DRAFT_318196 [Hyaloscypha variabilis F]|uniref:Uncharacterized protein n=1 Tax=Hyaloscypha variabilis (strain UAMH 11265 / GT02V1 / F) TaxID=1149755 RepID=A0A2J6RVY6_HYAVF|nr:hypothetical protein L207DRAFT_318196 [Hyaloscypha variabilis F]